MIVCPKCSKENQDHYKFCLGCGNELPRDSGGGRPFRAPTPTANPIVDVGRGSAVPGGIPPVASQPGPFPPAQQQPPGFAPQQPFSTQQQQPPGFAPQQPPQQPAYAQQPPGFAPQPPPFAQPQQPMPPPFVPPQQQAPVAPMVPSGPSPMAAAPISRPPAAMPATCPQCASPNPRSNRFCITCGFDMATVAIAQAPAPEVMSEAPTPPIAAPLPTAQAPRPAVERARLVLIRPDGTEGGHHSLMEGDSSVGRDTGGVFSNDPFLSPRHASFTVANGTLTVRDESSLNGIYIRIERQQPVELHDGDVFRIGQEILRFEAFHPMPRQADGTERIGAESEGLVGKIVLVTGRESFASAFPVPVTGLYLGRERGDILFPEDGYVSGLHCQLAVNQGRLTVTDVGSSNGSYVRLNGPRAVRNGDFLLLGQQLFRVHVL